jgi:hypothetical protein
MPLMIEAFSLSVSIFLLASLPVCRQDANTTAVGTTALPNQLQYFKNLL